MTGANCPTNEELQHLIDGSAVDGEQTTVIRHLDVCVPCQQRLEQLAVSDSQMVELVAHVDRDRPDARSAYWMALRQAQQGLSETLVPDQVAVLNRVHVAEPISHPPSWPTRSPGSGSSTGSSDNLDFLEPSVDSAYLGRLGHFEIASIIGRGGMGIVLEAFDAHLQRTVAVKVLDPQLADDETARQRFCREARAAAAITHENVVAVHQVERSSAQLPFLVMQLIQGETLEKKLAREGRLPVASILRIGMQAAAGLAAAHSEGLIHRDVKPGNILLETATNRVKLTDFGLARCIEDLKITRTGFVTGTPLYMAPEQALGQEIDERADLFSLGAVLYEMASGSPPFTGNSPLAVLKQIADSNARPVRALNPDIPSWLSDLIQKMLSKRPDERPISATEVAHILAERLAVIEPVSPVQIPTVISDGACQTVRRRHRRNSLMMLLAGALAGSVLSSGAAFLLLNRKPDNGLGPVGPPAVLQMAGNDGTVWAMAVTKDEQTLAMGIDVGPVKLWDLPSGRLRSTMPLRHGAVWALSISADGKRMATGHVDGSIYLYDLHASSQKEIRQLTADGPVRSLKFAPQGPDLLVGTRIGKVSVWDVDKGERTVETAGHEEGEVVSVDWSPDGTMIASASGDRTARIWNASDGSERSRLEGHSGAVYSVAFSPDSKVIATGSWDKTVRLWDTGDGHSLKTLEGHTADVWALAFSPKGNLLASGGDDHLVRLWDVKTGKPLPSRVGHTSAIYQITFTPSGKLVTSGRDGTARVWDVTQ